MEPRSFHETRPLSLLQFNLEGIALEPLANAIMLLQILQLQTGAILILLGHWLGPK